MSRLGPVRLSTLAGALLALTAAASACRSDEAKAAKSVDTAIDNATDQRQRVRDSQADVAVARAAVTAATTDVVAANDVLAARTSEVALARGEYLAQLHKRMIDVDVRIAAATGASYDQPRIAALRKELGDRARAAETVADVAWNAARGDLERTWAALDGSLAVR